MKKIFNKKIILFVSVAIISIIIYLEHNLKSNSLYYMKNLKPESELSTLVIAVENIDSIKVPKNYGVKYSISPEKDIHLLNTNMKSGKVYPRIKKYIEGEITYIDANSLVYVVDRSLKIYRIEKQNTNDIEYIEITDNRENVISEMKEVLKPVLEANQESPIINLQWIFDWKYKERFN